MLCCVWTRYGIILCQMDYIFIDGVAVLSLGYAMTLSYPECKLAKVFPEFLCNILSVFTDLRVTEVVNIATSRFSDSGFPGRSAQHPVF